MAEQDNGLYSNWRRTSGRRKRQDVNKWMRTSGKKKRQDVTKWMRTSGKKKRQDITKWMRTSGKKRNTSIKNNERQEKENFQELEMHEKMKREMEYQRTRERKEASKKFKQVKSYHEKILDSFMKNMNNIHELRKSKKDEQEMFKQLKNKNYRQNGRTSKGKRFIVSDFWRRILRGER